MPLAEAQALAPKLIVARFNLTADRRELEKLAEACEQFTPCVALEEGDEPESLLLDITNLEHLHGSEEHLARRVRHFFTRRGYQVRIAVAETIGMAWALAHFNAEGVACSRAAKRSVSMASSYMLTPLSVGNMPPIAHFEIASLPVEALRISPETTTLLHELGIKTIGQLELLPRDDLAQRFGDELLRRLDQFTGAATEAIEPHRAVAELEAAYSLEEPTAERAVLMHVLNELVQKLCGRLAARDQGAVLVLCSLYSVGDVRGGTPRVFDGRGENAQTTPFAEPQGVPPNTILRIGLVEPSANPRQLMELVDLHLETLTLSTEVDQVQIRVAALGRLGERQAELFADRWPSDPHQLAVLVNRLSSRLGHEQVLRAELRRSPVPERAVRLQTATIHPRGRKLQNAKCKLKNANWQTKKPSSAISNLQLEICNLQSPRPLLLHPQPQPLEVVCIAPDGPPQCVWFDNRREPVMHYTGPERIETLWWRGPTIRRDYYRIALESGEHLWIYRNLSNTRWFLHGVFA